MLTSAPGEHTRLPNRQAEPEESFLVPEITLLIEWHSVGMVHEVRVGAQGIWRSAFGYSQVSLSSMDQNKVCPLEGTKVWCTAWFWDTGCVRASPGQTRSAETCIAGRTPRYAAVVAHKLCVLLTSPSAHGESCSWGREMGQEVFFKNRQHMVENDDQVRQSLLVTRNAFSVQTGVFFTIICAKIWFCKWKLDRFSF